jgi:hypothetical protein
MVGDELSDERCVGVRDHAASILQYHVHGAQHSSSALGTQDQFDTILSRQSGGVTDRHTGAD